MRNGIRSICSGLVIALCGLALSALAREGGLSHVRIVRLSFVSGSVLVKHPHRTAWAKALVNTPIEQGFSVATSSIAFAQVQFENGSSANLAGTSKLTFVELVRAQGGGTTNRLRLDRGCGTFANVLRNGDFYGVRAGNATIVPRGKSEFRIDVKGGSIRVEVFRGSVRVHGPRQTMTLGKNKVLNYSTNGEQPFSITHGIRRDAWDKRVTALLRQRSLALNDKTSNWPEHGRGDDVDQNHERRFFNLPGDPF
jgi:ferric-dicitrate binding protein FerR (iron transport regulator)